MSRLSQNSDRAWTAGCIVNGSRLRHLARKAAPCNPSPWHSCWHSACLHTQPRLQPYACFTSFILSGCSSDVNNPTELPGAKDGPSGLEAWSAGQPCPSGCYDLIHGLFEANGVASVNGPCGSSVEATDEYSLSGQGETQTFEAVLQVTGTIAGSGAVFARLQSVGDAGAQVEVELTESGSHELVLPVTAGPYVGVRLVVYLRAAGVNPAPEGTTVGVATLRFRGLPANTSVISCQQYALPVPAAVASWGSMKALYR